MNRFFGRAVLLERIDELHKSNQHVSVVGARAIGKTAVLKAVVARHANGSERFAAAGMVDLRHDPPASTDAALRRVAAELREVFKRAGGGELKYLADEVKTSASAEELYDQLKIALEMVAEYEKRVLLVLDGCDPVLQNSAIPRNLWDNLRALGQIRSLRFMTGSRDQLHRLCYNPDARVSDFFRIFYDEPLIVGPFEDGDWKDVYSSCGITLDGAAEKEMVNWTGGHPDLVSILMQRLSEITTREGVGKREVDEAAESLLSGGSSRVQALWMECPDNTRGDIVQLTRGEMSVGEIPDERVRYLLERGIARRSGKTLRLANRFMERVAGARKGDISSARRLFERPEDFEANIRTVLELRLAQVRSGDAELLKLIRRAMKHLPEEPDGALGSARDILDRALDLIWNVEAPGGKVPAQWIEDWKFAGLTREVETFSRDPRLPDARGKQCGLLRLATGQQFVKPTTKKISKYIYALVEHMSQVGDLKNHSKSAPTVTMAVAFCMAAIELAEALERELGA